MAVTPAIAFEPDGYVLEGNQLMGRRAAGQAFLRGLVAASAGGELTCYTARRESAETFGRVVHELDTTITTRWATPTNTRAIAALGGVYLPDPRLGLAARARLRSGSDAYFLTGVTHTLSSASVTGMLADLVTGPTMWWDALICTSTAARAVAEDVMAQETDYLSWRFGTRIATPKPMLPVIPLGVHTGDFADEPGRRTAARAQLKLADDEVAFLFAGRLSLHGKAHPFQMLRGLQAASARTTRRLVLILAGQFFNTAIENAFRSALSDFAPNVRTMIIDGADAAAYADGWAAADVFVSLSDNVQETFGITPVEAMASGLPVVVSDWNGYKDTVRDGIDGFRVPSWAPTAGAGAEAAMLHESGMLSFDAQASASSTAISVDAQVLADRLAALADDSDLRARLGEAGRERACSVFDWKVVIEQYRALWAEQAAVLGRSRSAAQVALSLANAPRESAPYRDQTAMFASYPTAAIAPATRVSLLEGVSIATFDALVAHVTLNRWNPARPLVAQWLDALTHGPHTVAELATLAGIAPLVAADNLGRLAKMELVRLDPA